MASNRSCGTCTDTLGHLPVGGQRVGLGPRQASVLLTLAGGEGGSEGGRPLHRAGRKCWLQKKGQLPLLFLHFLMGVRIDWTIRRISCNDNVAMHQYCFSIASVLHQYCIMLPQYCIMLPQHVFQTINAN